MDQTPHVALLPSPGMGHLTPFSQLAKQLVQRHHFAVTILLANSGPPSNAQKALLETLPKSIKYMFLPPVDIPKDLNVAAQIFFTMSHSISSLRDTFVSLTTTTRLVALVVDPLGLEAFDIAKEFGLSKCLFSLSTAMHLSLCLHLPKLDEMVRCEYRELPEPVKLPGCVPVHGRELGEPFDDRSHEAYKSFLKNIKRIASADGIVMNTFMDLEEGAITALQVEEPGKKLPVYPIGPAVQTCSNDVSERSECLHWLDDQPSESVLYVSFGSGGMLSHDQLSELAFGLEMSGQKFLWVVRSPNDKSPDAAFFSVQSQNDPISFLPKGFLERTKEKGLVVPSWAPQIEVLSHGSTGGFLTHCGWNSTLESIVHGVPLIAWPLYAEQPLNAVMLTEGLNVALRPKGNESGLVGREEIAAIVKNLLGGEEGKIVRRKMKGLKDAAAKALSEDGSSTKSLSKLAFRWKNHKNV